MTELQAHFSTEQVADLNKITSFFKNQICIESPSDFGNCFKPIIKKFVKNGYEPTFNRINYNEQLTLYKSIDKSTFAEIWSFCELQDSIKTKFRSLCLKESDGKYINYLLNLGENNKFIEDYATKVIGSKNFKSSLLLKQIIDDNKAEFDLENTNIQLIIAIHFLTINDQIKRYNFNTNR